MERIFKAYNGPAPTSAQQLAVTSGTSVKTMLQLLTPATKGLWIVGWGVLHDGHSLCTSASAELLTNATGGATVTALNAADITKLNNPDAEASLVTTGTTSGGYTSTAENTLTDVNVLDSVYLSPTVADRHIQQWPLGREPHVAVNRWVRIRVTMAGNATNVRCWIEWGE